MIRVPPILVRPPRLYREWSPLLLPGLIGYWRFDTADVSGTTVADASGNNRPGTLMAGATIAAGKVKEAVQFNGSTQYVSVADDAVWTMGSADFTMAFWVNFASLNLSGTYGACMMSHDAGGGTSNNKWIFMYPGTAIGSPVTNRPVIHVYRANIAGTWIYGNQTWAAPALSTWHHLAVKRSGGSAYEFFANGVSIGTTTNSTVWPDVASDLRFGQCEGIAFLHGAMDEVCIYNRALSSSEIALLAAAQ